jgi:hypothetical protein
MEFTIKKKNLLIIIISALIVIVIGGIIASYIYHQQQSKNTIRFAVEMIDRSVKREYNSLLEEYKNDVKEYNDASDYDMREYYRNALLELTGASVLCSFTEEPSDEIDSLLMDKARQNVLNSN